MKAALDVYYPRSFFKLLLALVVAVVGCSGAPGVKPVPEKANLAGFRRSFVRAMPTIVRA